MIQVFFDKRGTGKTKALINLANERALNNKGDIVYIDDDKRPIYELNNKIRFISTDDFDLNHVESFYGFLCGIISEDYDIDTICIDGLSNIINDNLQHAAQLFYSMEKLSESGIDFYINVNAEQDLPDFMRKYVA